MLSSPTDAGGVVAWPGLVRHITVESSEAAVVNLAVLLVKLTVACGAAAAVTVHSARSIRLKTTWGNRLDVLMANGQGQIG